MRKILIIILSILILILFGVVGSVSYDMGISYGVKNAEKIRSENNKESIDIEKEIPTVNFKTAKNEISKIKINSSGRVLSYSNTTINSEVNGTILSNSKIKKDITLKKEIYCFKSKIVTQDFYLNQKSNYIKHYFINSCRY